MYKILGHIKALFNGKKVDELSGPVEKIAMNNATLSVNGEVIATNVTAEAEIKKMHDLDSGDAGIESAPVLGVDFGRQPDPVTVSTSFKVMRYDLKDSLILPKKKRLRKKKLKQMVNDLPGNVVIYQHNRLLYGRLLNA